MLWACWCLKLNVSTNVLYVLVVVTEQFVVRNGISAGVERPKRLGHNLFIA